MTSVTAFVFVCLSVCLCLAVRLLVSAGLFVVHCREKYRRQIELIRRISRLIGETKLRLLQIELRISKNGTERK